MANLTNEILKEKENINSTYTINPKKGGPKSFTEAIAFLISEGYKIQLLPYSNEFYTNFYLNQKIEPDNKLNENFFPNVKIHKKDTLVVLQENEQKSSPILSASKTSTQENEKKPSQLLSVSKTSTQENVSKIIIDILSEKTGYPVDMLELDLDLEADLSIDTVKQAEIFGIIRTRFNLESDPQLKISDYPTIRQIIEYTTNRIVQEHSDELIVPPESEKQFNL